MVSKKNKNHEEIVEEELDNLIEEVNSDLENSEIDEKQEANEELDPMAVLEQKIAELEDKNLRMMAEFDNYRRRTIKEKNDLIKFAGERIFVDILPVIDDFERAMDAMEMAEDLEAVKEGVTLIYDKFISYLEKNGVKEIPSDNEDFDVDLHEAITTFPAPSEDMKGKIIDCTSKGYTLNDKVIRFSKVVVGE